MSDATAGVHVESIELGERVGENRAGVCRAGEVREMTRRTRWTGTRWTTRRSRGGGIGNGGVRTADRGDVGRPGRRVGRVEAEDLAVDGGARASARAWTKGRNGMRTASAASSCSRWALFLRATSRNRSRARRAWRAASARRAGMTARLPREPGEERAPGDVAGEEDGLAKNRETTLSACGMRGRGTARGGRSAANHDLNHARVPSLDVEPRRGRDERDDARTGDAGSSFGAGTKPSRGPMPALRSPSRGAIASARGGACAGRAGVERAAFFVGPDTIEKKNFACLPRDSGPDTIRFVVPRADVVLHEGWNLRGNS